MFSSGFFFGSARVPEANPATLIPPQQTYTFSIENLAGGIKLTINCLIPIEARSRPPLQHSHLITQLFKHNKVTCLQLNNFSDVDCRRLARIITALKTQNEIATAKSITQFIFHRSRFSGIHDLLSAKTVFSDTLILDIIPDDVLTSVRPANLRNLIEKNPRLPIRYNAERVLLTDAALQFFKSNSKKITLIDTAQVSSAMDLSQTSVATATAEEKRYDSPRSQPATTSPRPSYGQLAFFAAEEDKASDDETNSLSGWQPGQPIACLTKDISDMNDDELDEFMRYMDPDNNRAQHKMDRS